MNRIPDNDQERLLREQSLAFFGAITASVSHELNNVISIIDQSAGLLGDLLAASREGKPLPQEKLDRIAESTRRQTQRGLGIIRRLNRFAHSVDRPEVEFDLGETTAAFGALCTRLADMKSTTLKVADPAGTVTVTGSPFLVQQWLFLVFKRMLDAAHRGDIIEISSGKGDNGPFVSIRGPYVRPSDGVGVDPERLLCNSLGAESTAEQDGPHAVIRLNLPRGQ